MSAPSPRVGRLRAAGLGPFVASDRFAHALGLASVLALTLSTQLGGVLLWPLIGLAARERGWARALVALLGMLAWALSAALLVPWLAAPFGRVPLPCAADGALAPRSFVYCVTLRNYVSPALRDEVSAIARELRAHDPDARVLYLDGAFPLPLGPILPHLSRGDGRRLDLALVFEDGTGSPIGYFGYVPLPPRATPVCPDAWLDLRWDLAPLQPLLGPPTLDVRRTERLVRAALAQRRIARAFLEPHVARRLGIRSSRLVFQRCHAARHDDHLHVELED